MVDEGGWQAALGRWLEPFLAELSHAAGLTMYARDIAGPIGLGESKSMQPMAARKNRLSCDSLQHFIPIRLGLPGLSFVPPHRTHATGSLEERP